jgi:hypothetical protein
MRREDTVRGGRIKGEGRRNCVDGEQTLASWRGAEWWNDEGGQQVRKRPSVCVDKAQTQQSWSTKLSRDTLLLPSEVQLSEMKCSIRSRTT